MKISIFLIFLLAGVLARANQEVYYFHMQVNYGEKNSDFVIDQDLTKPIKLNFRSNMQQEKTSSLKRADIDFLRKKTAEMKRMAVRSINDCQRNFITLTVMDKNKKSEISGCINGTQKIDKSLTHLVNLLTMKI